ncbi:hypothetical protein GMD78_10635 [Ornithinibacillus sp. L9]|uniref:Uncharacterized protein n=1 Tax=Ornithinibacillus caprae TaxID=2678566 RepID=A0A6N8FNA8_9BACI|nr:hypothetical protein [Ornithinibacillus caprae]MUK88848.1 hypothetical protein [Ornithinibacillus caprae]
MWWYWIIGIIILLIVIEETIYYLENRIAFGKRQSRIIDWFKSLKRKEEIPAGDKPTRRRKRE